MINKRSFKDILLFVTLAAVLGAFLWLSSPNRHHTTALLGEEGHGTTARSEREYKMSADGVNITTAEAELWAGQMKKLLKQRAREVGYWSVPNMVGNPYFTVNDLQTYLFRDIYFDTKEDLLEEHSVSYRLRNRFKSRQQHDMHIISPDAESAFPYRAEFQAKVGREDEGDGLSSVAESRFEFRDESEPFSKSNPPPPPPWPLREYIPYLQAGRFRGMVTYPAQNIMRYFHERTGAEELRVEPAVVLVTERTRQHLHIDTPFGSGPNPTQAFIISFDNVKAYNPEEYLAAVDKKFPMDQVAPVGTFVELEVEFERNVSEKLDEEIEKHARAKNSAEVARLEKIRVAFMADLDLIVSTLVSFLKEEQQIELGPQTRSKFGLASEFEQERSEL